MDKGLLLGFPFKINNNLTVGTDAHGLTDIVFGDFSQFLVGETLGLQIAVSQEATYYDGKELVSAFANDQTVMRALLREDFGVRYKDAFVVRQKVYTKA
jgi:HK97 family phage major capsid protein